MSRYNHGTDGGVKGFFEEALEDVVAAVSPEGVDVGGRGDCGQQVDCNVDAAAFFALRVDGNEGAR